MAVPKIVGIETEYGVALRGAPDPNPGHRVEPADQRLRRAPPGRLGLRGRVARAATRAGFARDGSQPPEVETHLVNAVLTNGARYYVDHAHPEYSTPECSDPLQVVLFDKAGERILARSMDAARQLLPAGQEIVVYKNNSDGKGNSYGCHENYLVDRAVPFATLVRNLIPWFVTRQVFTGAGKVGSENGADAVDFQISQRADFFEEEVGLETTLKRPIVNTRDEPHADPQKYRRLHVIVGDANLCEVATFLKVGTTAIVLAMIEDGFIDKDLSISGPVPAMRTVSHDPTCRATVEVAVARPLHRGRAAVGVPAPRARSTPTRPASRCAAATRSAREVLDRWEQALTALERDPSELDGQLDWVTKWNLLACVRRPRRPRAGTTRSCRCSTSSTTTCAPRGRCTSGWCAPARSSAWSTRPTCAGEWSIRRRPPGPISGVPASHAGPTPWSPPTGTAWSSTSAPTRCEGSR